MTIYNREYTADDFTFAHQKDEKLIDTNFKATRYAHDVWCNFKKNKGALIGAIIVIIIVLLALIGPHMTEHTYKSIIHGHECLTPRIPVLEKLGDFHV